MLHKLLLALVICVSAFTTLHASTKYYVTITVTDSLTGETLKGASIELVEAGTATSGRTTAIEQFARPGHYYADVSVDHDRYAQQAYEVRTSLKGYQEGRDTITFKKGDRTDVVLTISLKRQVKGQLIHVTVLSSLDDKPVNEASVWVAYSNGVTGPDGKTSVEVNEPTDKGFHPLAIYACTALSTANQFVLETRAALMVFANGLNKFEKMVSAASQACATVPGLRAQIQGFVSTTKSKEATLKGKLDTANGFVCKTKADAAALEALWNQIIPLAWDVNLNAAKAEGLNNRLRRIITDADVIAARFDKADAETPVPLSDFSKKWQEMATNLKNHRDNVLNPACEAVRNKRAECIKAHDDAINLINAAVAKAGLKSDPRAEAFKTNVRA